MLIQEIDAFDNQISISSGSQRYRIHSSFCNQIKNMNPPWNDTNIDEQACFNKALEVGENTLIKLVMDLKDIWWPARKVIEDALKTRKTVHPKGDIIIIEIDRCPWVEHLYELEDAMGIEKKVKFVIQAEGEIWKITAVPKSMYSNKRRALLHEDWRGLDGNDLEKVSGIKNALFVHYSRAIGGNITKEGAIEMALKSTCTHVAQRS